MPKTHSIMYMHSMVKIDTTVFNNIIIINPLLQTTVHIHT